jgi:transcriptional regulator EpsA
MQTIYSYPVNEPSKLLHALHSLIEVRSKADFIDWTDSDLHAVLPHEMMHCYLGVLSNGRLLPHAGLTRHFPSACIAPFLDAQGTLLTPFMRLSYSTGKPQLFEPGPDATLSHDEMRSFVQYGLRNIAAHSQTDTITGSSSYFSFSRVSGPLSVQHMTLLRLLVPPMHAALGRVVRNAESTAQTAPAAPGSAGHFYLTKREMEILDWIKEGKTNWEIAHIVNCSPTTVKTHLQRIFAKMNVPNRAKAAVLWAERIAAMPVDSGAHRLMTSV